LEVVKNTLIEFFYIGNVMYVTVELGVNSVILTIFNAVITLLSKLSRLHV